MTPDGLEIARKEHDLELLREAKKEFYFDDDDLAEDRERERAREDEIFYARYGW